MSKKIVIIGGGTSAKNAAQGIRKGSKDVDITIIQANKFVEWPIPMTMVLVNPELHPKALHNNPAKYEVKGVNYVYGVAESVDTSKKIVNLAGDISSTEAAKQIPYDILIVATGFHMPLIYPGLGVTLESRMEEVRRVADVIAKANTCVVAGGGVVGLEMVGDIRAKYPEKRIILACRSGVLKQWDQSWQKKVEAQLKKMKIEVLLGNESAPAEPSLEPGTMKIGGNDVNYDVYLPMFGQGPNTKYLQGTDVLDAKGNVDVNEFLQSKAAGEIFSVGVSNAPEPFICIPKLEAQWNSVSANVVATLSGRPMKAHKEGMPGMKLPMGVLIGHGPNAYAYIDFNQVPAPCKCCCCMGYAGWPCCPPCWPCCACGGCGCCPLGYCCTPPEGKGPATLMGKTPFFFGTQQFPGMGEGVPVQQTMQN